MKLESRFTWANLITIGMLLGSIAVSWGVMDTNVESLNARIDEKADKEVVDVTIEFIKQDLMEIKEMLKDMKN
jgi:hypothetical protein